MESRHPKKWSRSLMRVVLVQTSPISFVARGKGNRRRLHAGNYERWSHIDYE